MKTFLNFYLIPKALKAYLVVGSGMYESGFSKKASMINDIPYETVFI